MNVLWPEQKVAMTSNTQGHHYWSEFQAWVHKQGWTPNIHTARIDEEGRLVADITRLPRKPREMTTLRVVENKPVEPTIDVQTITNHDYVGYTMRSDFAILTKCPHEMKWGFVYADEIIKGWMRGNSNGTVSLALKFKCSSRHAAIRKALTTVSTSGYSRTLLCSDSLGELMRSLKTQMINEKIREAEDC